MKQMKWDIYIGIGILMVLILFASQLPRITPIARVYPMVVAIGTLLCVLLLLRKTTRKPIEHNTERMTKKTIKTILLYLLLILIYILSWDILGFVISNVLFTMVSIHYLGLKNTRALIAFPIILTVVLYIVFTRLIMVSLPIGTLVEGIF